MIELGMVQRRRMGLVGEVPMTRQVSKIVAQIAQFTLVNSNCTRKRGLGIDCPLRRVKIRYVEKLGYELIDIFLSTQWVHICLSI